MAPGVNTVPNSSNTTSEVSTVKNNSSTTSEVNTAQNSSNTEDNTVNSSSQPPTDRRSSIPDLCPRSTRYPRMWDAQLATLMLFDTNKDNMACQ